MAAVFNLVTISPSAGLAQLSSKATYPYFLRTTAPHTVWVPAAVELCKHFRWSRVATIAEAVPVPLGTMAAFLETAADAGIEVVVNKQLDWGGSDYSEAISETLNAIASADARVIVIYAEIEHMRHFFCDAYRRGLVGKKYVYMLPGRERSLTHTPSRPPPPGPHTSSHLLHLSSLPSPRPLSRLLLPRSRPSLLFPQGSWISGEWWKRVPGIDVHTCTDAELKQATQGYISTAPSTQTMSPATLPGATGDIAVKWRLRYKTRAEAMGVQPGDFAATAYDAIVRFLHHPHRPHRPHRRHHSHHNPHLLPSS